MKMKMINDLLILSYVSARVVKKIFKKYLRKISIHLVSLVVSARILLSIRLLLLLLLLIPSVIVHAALADVAVLVLLVHLLLRVGKGLGLFLDERRRRLVLIARLGRDASEVLRAIFLLDLNELGLIGR